MSAIAAASPARPNALWQALSRNRLSWVGIGLLLLIVLAAVLAPWLAPHDPLQQNIAYRLSRPRPSSGWAPTATAATCCRA